MAEAGDETAPQSDDGALLEFFRSIAARDHGYVSEKLDSSPELAVSAISVGASRQDAETYFFTEIQHYVYAGDTGLHIAAAAYEPSTAELLIASGAPLRARNREVGAVVGLLPASGHGDPRSNSESVVV